MCVCRIWQRLPTTTISLPPSMPSVPDPRHRLDPTHPSLAPFQQFPSTLTFLCLWCPPLQSPSVLSDCTLPHYPPFPSAHQRAAPVHSSQCSLLHHGVCLQSQWCGGGRSYRPAWPGVACWRWGSRVPGPTPLEPPHLWSTSECCMVWAMAPHWAPQTRTQHPTPRPAPPVPATLCTALEAQSAGWCNGSSGLTSAGAIQVFVAGLPGGTRVSAFPAHSTVSYVFHWIVSVADNELEPQHLHGLWVGGSLKTELEERLHDMRRVVWDSVAQANRSGVPPSIRPYFGGLLGVVKT